jgi:hypothetical protein
MALTGSRNSAGMGIGAIPYPTITEWARDHGIEDPDEIELVVFGIQAVDGEFLKHMAKQLPKPKTPGREPKLGRR